MKNSTSLFGAFKGFTSNLFLVLFAFFTSWSVWGQTYFTESFESTWYLNGNINTPAVSTGGANAPLNWSQTRVANTADPVGGTALGAGDWSQAANSSGSTYAGTTVPYSGTATYSTSYTFGAPPAGSKVLWLRDGSISSTCTRRMESPVIDLSTSINPVISFSYVYPGSGSFLVVASNDGGATWNTIATLTTGTALTAWVNRSVVLPSTYKVSSFKLGIQLTSSYGSYDCFVDNIVVKEPSSYTWNATSGTAAWATASNWTPARNTPDITDILNFSNGGSSIVQTASGAVGGTISFTNNTTANFQPTAANTLSLNGLSIANGSNLYLNGSIAQTITFAGGTNTIDGRLELSGAAHSISFANTVTTVSSTGVLAAGGATAATITGTTATLIINGTYEHKYTTVSGTLPTATWSDGSNCNIIGYTTTVTAHPSYAQSFWNFTWNCPSQTAAITGAISGSWIVRNNLNLISTGSSGTFTNSGTSTYAIKNINLSGGTFNLASSTASYTITGDFIKTGGTMTPTGACTFNFAGTAAQNLTLDGLSANPVTWRFSNPSGVTITGTGSFPSSFPIGNGTNGGVRISTTVTTPLTFAGTITNGFNYNTANSTLTYDATTGSTTARAIEFPSTNGPTNLTVAVAGANVLVLPFSRTISGTLTMTSGDIDISSNNLTLGTSSTVLGTLTWTAGSIRVTTGTLTRWFGTTGLPTAAGTAIGYFPLAVGVNNRNTSIYFSSATGLTTAGTITVGHTNSGGLSTISTITDGTYNIDTRANSNWSISTGNGIAGSATIGLRLTGGGMFNTSTVANLRLMQANSIIGTHATGTGTSPNFQALRTGLTLAQIVNNHYIGAASADMQLVFNSIASGDWNNPSTWDAGSVPVCTGLVNIMSGHNVTVNSSSNNASTTTINAGGTLTISSGDLTVGCTNNNSLLSINGGTLNVSGGTLNVNGKFAVGANVNSVFIQSGGSVIVDGNSGTLATSIDAHVVDMYCHTTSTLQLTGGTFTVVDPTLSATTTNCSFKVYPTVAHSSGPNWTLILGNGVSNNPGGHSGGFLINLTNTNSFAIGGTVILNSPWAANRFVTTSNAIPLNNLTITKGDWRLSSPTYIAGNLTNNDTLTHATSSSNLVLSNFSGSTASVSSNTQTISGTGFFRNNAVNASKTADLIGLTINNNNATGVTIGVPLSISGTLTMTSGIINTTPTNILTLGTATLAGTLSCTPSSTNFINGPFTRTFPIRTATGTYTVATLFPVGVSSSSLPIYIDPTTTAVTKFTARAFNTMPGTSGAGVSNLASVYWSAIPDNSANVPSSRIQLNHSSISSTTKLLYSQLNNGAFGGTPGGSSSVSATSVTSAMDISPYYNFYSYGDLVTCSTPTNQATALSTSNKTTTSFTGTITPASSNPTGYLVVRYASGATPTAPSNNTLYTVGAAIGAGSVRAIVYGSPFQFNESSLTSGTTYDYYVYAFNNSGCAGPTYNSTSPLMSSVTTCGGTVSAPTTNASTALPFSNLSSNGFTINWVNPTTAPTAPNTLPQDYLLDVSTNSGFTSFVPGFENFNMGANPPYSVTGLAAGTTYFVRIKGNDNGCSSSTLAFNHIATLGSSSVTSFNFNFDNGTSGTSTIWPSGVARYRPVGTTTEYIALSTSYASSQTNSVYMYGTSTYSPQGILVLPSVSNSNAGTHRINFKYLVSTANVVGQFGYLSNAADPTTFVQIGNNFSSATTGSWLNINIPLPNTLPQNITLAFRNNGSVSGGIYFDDIIYEAIPTPIISSVTSSVPCGVSTLVTITGTELANASVSIGGTAISLTSNTSTQITATVNTTFSGTVQVTTAGGTATSSTSITFTAAPSLTINSGSQSNCTGVSNTALTTLTSNASSYSTYTWSPSTNITGDQSNGWTFNPTTTTTYTLTATNGAGCSNSLSKVVTVNASPSAVSLTPNSTQNLCVGAVQSIVASGGAINSNGTAVLGTSTNTSGTTSYPNPFSGYYGGVKHQLLYTAAELITQGLSSGSSISAISFSLNAFAANACTNLTIRIGTTSTTSLSGFVSSANTTVYGPATFTPSATGSITFNFSTPFSWNGTSNLVIEIVHNAGNGGNGSGTQTNNSTTSFSSVYYGASDNVSSGISGFDALTSWGSSGSSTSRPNVTFVYSTSVPSTVVFSPNTDLYNDINAITNYSGNPTTVYSKPTANRTYTATATTAAGCSTSASVSITVTDTYTWTGATSTDPSVASNWNPSAVPCSGANEVIPTGLTNYPSYTNLTINSGTTFTVQSGAKLDVSGVLTNNGTLTLESGATLVQGTSSTLAGTGTYNVKQTITGANNGSTPSGRFWYLGSPVTLASSSAYFTSNAANVVKKRDEVNNAWTALSSGTPENLVVGQGYYTQAMGNATINFTGGLLNNGAITIGNLTRTAGQGFEGFNLVSNPYPSYLDWDAVTKTDVGNTMWYRTASGSTAGSMVFDTYVAGTGGIGTNLNGAGVSNLIPPMQSFWVRVNSGSTTGSLGLTNSMRAHFTSINGSTAGLKSTSNERDLFLRMNLLQANKKDQIIVYVNDIATNGFDQYDGEKMMQAGLPQFYTSAAGKKITINGLNSAKKQQKLPITIELPTTGVHSFVIEDLEIDNGLVWLEDKQEEIMQALEPGTVYEFYANSGINAERFVLHFQLLDTPTPTNTYNEVGAYANFNGKGASVHAEAAGVVVIKLPASTEGITDIQIRDAAGKLVYTGSTNTLETSVQLAQANGIYYVTLNSASGVEVRKVFIQQ